MEHKKVSIIILTWNGLSYTKHCLDTLIKNTVFSNFEIVVVDNGSTDGTLEYLDSLGSAVLVIRNGKNLGFVKGNNIGLSQISKANDVILLNNDTEVYQPNWIEELQKTAYEESSIGVVGCRLQRPGGILQHAGAYIPPTYWGQQIGSNEDDINQYNSNQEVDSVVFACVYIKRSVLDEVGFLDEDYFSYFEDTDYCLKAKSKGYKIVCCGGVTIIHHENVSTDINQIRHKDLFEKSQKTFRQKWEYEIEAKRYQEKLDWHSIINFPSGYAISSKQLCLSMDKQGIELAYKYVYGPGTVFPVVEPEMSDSYMINVIRQRDIGSSDIQVVYGQGDVFEKNFGKYKIGYTMLETTGIPKEWVDQANMMDEVWVPSTFNVDTFKASGVSKPIYTIPLGIDPNYFNPNIQGYPIQDTYTFLSIFEWGERKAPEIMLKAFNDEFRADENVVLICKTFNSDAEVSVASQIQNLRLQKTGGRIIFSLNEVIPTYQLGALYRSADCFALSTRGEGWGMPVLEAMACGIPVIATDWSAHCDFMNKDNAYPIEVERMIPAEAKCPYYEGFQWAQPSYEHLRTCMRYIYEHKEEARQKGLVASKEVLSTWTWDNAASKIIQRIRDIRNK